MLVPDKASLHAVVHGHVQGVFFRAFVVEKAKELQLTGYARNLPSGVDVEIQAEGNRPDLEKLIDYLKVGPPAARVEKVVTDWSKTRNRYPHFSIRY
jgi:acylphosphatase